MAERAWLGEVASAVASLTEDLFLLLLDDYALCAPARTAEIARAASSMRNDSSIAFFPLCWYPAHRRDPDPSHPGIVRLVGAPVLLQAAIWRREGFLRLTEGIDPHASAWGFEALTTQKLRSHPQLKICAFNQPEPAWLGGTFIDGFEKRDWPLPYHNLLHRGQPALEHESFLHAHGLSFPSRGLGDSIAKLTRAVGLAPKGDCGCARRRDWMNQKVPYQ